MTRKRRRLIAVLAGLGMLALATGLVLIAFSDNLVFFYSPSDLATKSIPNGRRLRIGGLVENASVIREADGKTISFRITDGSRAVPVIYSGVVPDRVATVTVHYPASNGAPATTLTSDVVGNVFAIRIPGLTLGGGPPPTITWRSATGQVIKTISTR